MSANCKSINNKINLGNLGTRYSSLSELDKRNLDLCLEEKYKSISPKCDTMPTLLDTYDKDYQKYNTSNEINEQSKYLYISNLMYLIFKVLLFILLGFFYFKYVQPSDVITKINENIKTVQ